MQPTQLTLHRDFQIGEVDQRLFSGFSEHVGRIIYDGIYNPQSIHADEDGFRTDVCAALKKLKLTMVRYPGGNFSSGYHWRDGVGPRDKRPTVLERAFNSTETNQFGTDEFMKLCAKMSWQPMITANLGTGTPEEAADWVEYCNLPAGTRWADLRVANGTPEPYAVKHWCLGNEIDGPWQLGHVPAHEYALRAMQAAKMMKDTDKSIQVVASGTCYPDQPSYIDWDRTVLETVGDLADYLSLHYYAKNNGDTADFLAITNVIDRFIENMDAVCRTVQAKRRSQKRIYLSFDEYNVFWNHFRDASCFDGQRQVAPRITEEVYSLEDALVFSGFLHSFLRHADVVKIANVSQLVNAIGILRTEGDQMVRQSVYWPLAMLANRREGISLRPVVQGPSYEAKTNGTANFIDASAILGDGRLNIFLTNRSLDESVPVKISLPGFAAVGLTDAAILTGPGAQAVNTFEKPDLIRAKAFKDVRVGKSQATLTMPPLSFVAMTIALR
jgi:alpha-N-arabinofuranosidase